MRAAWSDSGLSIPRRLARWCGRTVALMLLLCELRAHGEEMYESVLWQSLVECQEIETCMCNGIPLENTTADKQDFRNAAERTAWYRASLENLEVFASHLFVRVPAQDANISNRHPLGVLFEPFIDTENVLFSVIHALSDVCPTSQSLLGLP